MAPYRYDQYRNPYISSISDLMQREGEIRARAAQQAGDAHARAAEARGQIWGGAAQMIGQIPQQMQQQQRAGREDADRLALDKAYTKPGGREAIINALPGHLRPIVSKQFAEADAAAMRFQKAQDDVEAASNDYLAGLGQSVVDHGYDLGAAGLALQHARNTYENGRNPERVREIDQIAQQIQADPNNIKAIADRLVTLSPKRMEIAGTAAGRAETARHNEVVETTADVNATRASDAQKETARHNAAVEALSKQAAQPNVGSFEDYVTRTYGPKPTPDQIIAARKAYGQADDRALKITVPGSTGALTPDGVEFAGTQYRLTGKMPALGMSNSEARAAIVSEAAAQVKALRQSPITAIQKQAAYRGDEQAMKRMQTMSASAESFESKALAQADIVAGISADVWRTKSPLINAALLAGKKEIVGDADTQLLFNAITTFTSEYAKIMEGSTGSVAASSDSARKASSDLIKASLNHGALIKTLDLMKREMRLSIQGYDATIAHITERMGGQPLAPTPPPKTVTVAQIQAVAAKNGTTYAQEKARAESEGYVIR